VVFLLLKYKVKQSLLLHAAQTLKSQYHSMAKLQSDSIFQKLHLYTHCSFALENYLMNKIDLILNVLPKSREIRLFEL
jgi:hypothetical protein